MRAGVVSLVAGVAILGTKLLAWRLTGSTVLLADAAESVVNVVAAAAVTWSLVVSRRPPDDDHPYGHGKAEALSAMLEGGLILTAAAAIAVEALRTLWVGPELERLGSGIAVSALSGAANLVLGGYLLAVARREQSQALRADGMHVLTDTITTAGGIAALLAVTLTGWPILDPLVALLVALNILRAGWALVRGAVQGLLDEADPTLLARLAGCADRNRRPDWCDIHQMRSWSSGRLQHVDLHLVVPRYLSIEAGHATADLLEADLLECLAGRGDVVIHVDPCRSDHCAGCTVTDCPVRARPLDKPAPFGVAELTEPGGI